MLVGDLHPLEQRNEFVFFARQARLDVVMLMQKTAHVVGDFQHDVFFLRAFVADRAGVDAAVAGIDHHQLFAAGRFRRRFAVLIAQQAFRPGAMVFHAEQRYRQAGKQKLASRRRNGKRLKIEELFTLLFHYATLHRRFYFATLYRIDNH